MTKNAIREQTKHRWYTRPVLFVADINRALRFYVDLLGFEKSWHEGDGAGTVSKSIAWDAKSSFASMHTRRDKARLFVELTVDGLTALGREIIERSVPSEKSWWGSDVIKIIDPDGNELLFPLAEESKQWVRRPLPPTLPFCLAIAGWNGEHRIAHPAFRHIRKVRFRSTNLCPGGTGIYSSRAHWKYWAAAELQPGIVSPPSLPPRNPALHSPLQQ